MSATETLLSPAWRMIPSSWSDLTAANCALKTLVTISKDERAPHAARVSASQAILDRAYGKAPTLNTGDPTVMKRAIDMTDDELAAIAGGATLTLVKSDI